MPLRPQSRRIQVDVPLPFGTHDDAGPPSRAADDPAAAGEPPASGGRLAAAAQTGEAPGASNAPLARGEPLASWPVPDELRDTAPAGLPALWRTLGAQLSGILTGMPSPEAPQALDDAARRLAALVARAPDVALFLAVRPDRSQATPYGVERSLQAATTALLVGARMHWTPERCITLVKAAFTMNVGMLDLQERLSNQARLPNPAQRRAILGHPLASARMLKDSGVADEAWLQAVAEHHEVPGGGGYPAGLTVVCETANALRTVDIYTAKLAGRSGRDALVPERALRELLLDERGNPFAQAIAAEFGPHPPGTTVRLHTGEIGVVVQRGAQPGAPRVAVVTSRRAQAVAEPFVKEAAGREHGIAAQVDPRQAGAGAETLYAKLSL